MKPTSLIAMKRSLTGDSRARYPYPRSRGFTLRELLVILSVLSIQVLMLLPALAKAKTKDQGIICMNNNKQLLLAWRLYASDNQDNIPHSYGNQHGWMGTSSLDYNENNPSNYDPNQDIKKGPLWKYSGDSTGIYKCPSDKSVIQYLNVTYPRVRTMSMSAWVGGNNGISVFNGSSWKLHLNISDFTDPGPSSTWIFTDEREDSINDGSWITDMTAFVSPRATRIVDYPGSYHDVAGSFSFADGHTELNIGPILEPLPP